MKYHIEKNTVQETLVIPLYGCSATRFLRNSDRIIEKK